MTDKPAEKLPQELIAWHEGYWIRGRQSITFNPYEASLAALAKGYEEGRAQSAATQYTCPAHANEVNKGGECVWCQLARAQSAAPSQPIAGDALPQDLLDLIGNYGIARSSGCSEAQIVHKWEQLIAGIKRFAAPSQRLHILFDGPPGPDAGRFVEVEDDCGKSVNAGEWNKRSDGYWELVISAPSQRVPHEKWTARYTFDLSDTHTKLFCAASDWMDRALAAESALAKIRDGPRETGWANHAWEMANIADKALAAPQPAQDAAQQDAERWQHVKTGGIYRKLMYALRESDKVMLVIYESEQTGERWARPLGEFNDGRFVRVSGDATPPAAPRVDDAQDAEFDAAMAAAGITKRDVLEWIVSRRTQAIRSVATPPAPAGAADAQSIADSVRTVIYANKLAADAALIEFGVCVWLAAIKSGSGT